MKPLSLATLVLSATLLAGCAKSPESTVESFYRAVGKGEITEAQSYLSTQVVSILGSQKLSAALAREASRVSECGGIKSVDVQLSGQGEVRSGTAVVTYGGPCEAKRESVKLLKEDGKWKIGASK